MRKQEQTKQMKKSLGIVYIIICVEFAKGNISEFLVSVMAIKEKNMKKVGYFFYKLAAVLVVLKSFSVCAVIAVAQSVRMALQGERLLGFQIGFIGSIICIIFRFVYLILLINEQKRKKLRKVGVCYVVIWTLIMICILLGILIQSNFTLMYEYLRLYNKYQFFMVGLLFVQWAGFAIFSNKYYESELFSKRPK